MLYNMKLTQKVEGAKTNTYKRLPIANALLPWIIPHGVGVPMPTSDGYRYH